VRERKPRAHHTATALGGSDRKYATELGRSLLHRPAADPRYGIGGHTNAVIAHLNVQVVLIEVETRVHTRSTGVLADVGERFGDDAEGSHFNRRRKPIGRQRTAYRGGEATTGESICDLAEGAQQTQVIECWRAQVVHQVA